MLGATTKLVVLTAALAGASLTGVSVAGADVASGAHLSQLQVSRIAALGFEKAGYGAAAFHARRPSFDPKEGRWFVFFIQVGTTAKVDGHFETAVPIDGDMLVVVDDHSGKVCVQQAIGIGSCT
jgi:hypothetical protein